MILNLGDVFLDGMQFPAQVFTVSVIRPNFKVYYPAVWGLQNSAAQYIINNTIIGLVNELIKNQFYPDESFIPDVTGTYEIKNNQRNILSLTIENYTYAGGAHGLTLLKSLTFDIKTGKNYELKELFKDGADYVKVLSDIISSQIKDRNIFTLNEFKSIKPDQDFYIADKVLVVYFQLYEITPYAFGFPYFPISVYEIKDIIDEEGPLGKMLY
jgi:hypothetical protein